MSEQWERGGGRLWPVRRRNNKLMLRPARLASSKDVATPRVIVRCERDIGAFYVSLASNPEMGFTRAGRVAAGRCPRRRRCGE